MKIEKICEYFNEIGILEFEKINIFLGIYSKLNNEKYTRLIDKIRDTLIIYINNHFIKNNQLSTLCENILTSFSNYQLILKYRTLNNMKNILLNKINNKYINFFLNLSFYLLTKDNKSKVNIPTRKKSKNQKMISKKIDNYNDNNKNKLNVDNNDLISSDDEKECTFTPQINKNFKGYKKPINNIESHIYYSPAFNISSKFPLNNYQDYIPSINNNQYNNIKSNIQRDNINILNNGTENSFYSSYSNYNNYNNLNISNDSRSNRSYKFYENINSLQNQNFNNSDYRINNEYINNDNFYNNKYYNNNRMINNNNYNNDQIRNYNQNISKRYINNINFNNSDIIENYNRNDDFFNKEMVHVQRVKDKIQNMKIEKLNKINEECTFEPKINTNYKSFYPQKKEIDNYQQPQIKSKPPQSYKSIPININKNNNNIKLNQIKKKEILETIKENENINQNSFVSQKKKDNKKRSYSEKKKGLKIIEDLSLAKKRRTEKTKKLLKERNFTPKIKKYDKYKDHITMSFEERRLKSIALKNKYKKTKKEENIVNSEQVLAPGEMVRYKDNKNNLNENFENKNMDINNEENIKLNRESINNEDNNKEENESLNNNINKKEMEKNKMLLMDKIKGEHKIGFKIKKEDDENEEKEKKEENINIKEKGNINEERDKEEIDDNNKMKEKIDSSINNNENNNNKKPELSFNTSMFHSKSLKAILNQKNNNS